MSLAVVAQGPVAHVGHWAVNLLYLAPVLLTVAALLIAARLRPGRPQAEADDG